MAIGASSAPGSTVISGVEGASSGGMQLKDHTSVEGGIVAEVDRRG
jgi:hypothetical protein